VKTVQTLTSLHLSHHQRAQLIEHALAAYPFECCGLLLGRVRRGAAVVERVIPAANIAEGDRCKRFQVDWRTLLDAYRLARVEALEVFGSYHSHPEGPVRPSVLDEREALSGHVCVIVGPVLQAEPQCGAWVLSPMGTMTGIDVILSGDSEIATDADHV